MAVPSKRGVLLHRLFKLRIGQPGFSLYRRRGMGRAVSGGDRRVYGGADEGS